MRDGGYRDPLAALKNRVAEKRGQVPRSDAFLSLARRVLLPPATVREIESLDARAWDKAATLDALTAVDRALDLLTEQYDHARKRLQLLRGPFDPPEPPDRGHDGVAPDLSSDAGGQAERLGGTMSRWGSGGAFVRFRSQDVPMVYAVRPTSRDDVRAHAHLRAPVTAALPPLAVRLERFTDSILAALGIKHEVELRIFSFDRLFWIESSEACARALLVPRVRDALRALQRSRPLLNVWGGVAELEWDVPTGSAQLFPDAAQIALDAMLAVLASV
jgi:hypothetical protein